jgi:uncharacterized integral membrane protein
MSEVQEKQEQKVKKSVSIRTILLVVFVAAVTVFAVKNWTRVPVWPIGADQPLALVIAIAFVLGAVIGWLAQSILNVKRALRRRANDQ